MLQRNFNALYTAAGLKIYKKLPYYQFVVS